MAFERFQSAHFTGELSDSEKRELFKDAVTNVIVESSSFCNRACTYCPVSKVDRKSSSIDLSSLVFEKIIRDLATINYDQSICLNLYNEPMADRPGLVRKIKMIRTALPASRIYFSTNGDYLSVEYLQELVSAGLSELYVSIHVPPGKDYDDAYSITRFGDLSRRLEKAVKVDVFAAGLSIHGHATVCGIRVNAFATNYHALGSDRAGSIELLRSQAIKRVSPCDRPFHDFTISYEGTIFPCCQLFVDEPVHKEKYSVGNIADFDTIFDAYASEVMAAWRRDLLTFSPKASPCETCSEGCITWTEEAAKARLDIYRDLIGPGAPEWKPQVEPSEAPPAPPTPPTRVHRLIKKILSA